MNDVEHFSRLIGELARALVAQPDDRDVRRALAVAANGLGFALHAQGDKIQALAAIRRAIAVDPSYTEAARNAGNLLCELDRYDEARVIFAAVAAQHPDDAQALAGLGMALRGIFKPDEAVRAFEAALARDPSMAETWCDLGSTLAELGDFDRATEAIDRALDLAPRNARIYQQWTAVRRVTAADAARVSALERLVEDAETLDDARRAYAHFALGKAYDDLGRYEEAFSQWIAGNAVKRAMLTYDEDATLERFERIAAHFSAERISVLRDAGDSSHAPIFIIGMPRSGTTLIEQILARHPRVDALGERMDLAWVIDAAATERGVPYPALIDGLEAADLRSLGARYLAAVGASADARTTDKMPENFVHAGMIALALPNARIIHAMRDPVDTCISCFAQLFTYGNQHTFDLAELGRYYRAYERLMEHWRAVLPAGMMLDVHYEDVVAAPETQARRILAHVGLAWDDGVLEFHRARNAVRTASLAQVRRPIYATSIGRHARYGDAIAPLLDALERR